MRRKILEQDLKGKRVSLVSNFILRNKDSLDLVEVSHTDEDTQNDQSEDLCSRSSLQVYDGRVRTLRLNIIKSPSSPTRETKNLSTEEMKQIYTSEKVKDLKSLLDMPCTLKPPPNKPKSS